MSGTTLGRLTIGRDDRNTSSLESQIRGSRYAWNIRIISLDALSRLMRLKETVEDPSIIERISTILIPREFTKLDEIIDLVFFTAQDVKEDDNLEGINNDEIGKEIEANRATPVSFHNECVRKLEINFKQSLIKQSKTTYSTSNDSIRISCAISKEYSKGNQTQYWFAFHPFQKSFLENVENSYVAFGCGTEKSLIKIPFKEFSTWLEDMITTELEKRTYWHIHIRKDGESFTLIRRMGTPQINLNNYLIS